MTISDIIGCVVMVGMALALFLSVMLIVYILYTLITWRVDNDK